MPCAGGAPHIESIQDRYVDTILYNVIGCEYPGGPGPVLLLRDPYSSETRQIIVGLIPELADRGPGSRTRPRDPTRAGTRGPRAHLARGPPVARLGLSHRAGGSPGGSIRPSLATRIRTRSVPRFGVSAAPDNARTTRDERCFSSEFRGARKCTGHPEIGRPFAPGPNGVCAERRFGIQEGAASAAPFPIRGRSRRHGAPSFTSNIAEGIFTTGETNVLEINRTHARNADDRSGRSDRRSSGARW